MIVVLTAWGWLSLGSFWVLLIKHFKRKEAILSVIALTTQEFNWFG